MAVTVEFQLFDQALTRKAHDVQVLPGARGGAVAIAEIIAGAASRIARIAVVVALIIMGRVVSAAVGGGGFA